MISSKKNQHYVPKFYLRNFSYLLNQKQLGIFDTKTRFFINNGALKPQGARNFFYGADGIIEDKLAEIEGEFATCVREIINTKTLPSPNSVMHEKLLKLIAVMDLRNPSTIDNITEKENMMKNKLRELHPEFDVNKFKIDPSHNKSVELSLSNVEFVVELCRDLRYKLILNNTNTPFICSDVPLVKYNQFLEGQKWQHGKTGYGNIGFQMLLPLNPTICLLFYDSRVYRIGNKKDNYVKISNEQDIDQLNLLQVINCNESLFFNEGISQHYMNKLLQTSSKFQKANQPILTVYKSSEKGNVFQFNTTDCAIRLEIEGIKKSSRASGVHLTNSVAQLRPHAIEINKQRDKF